MIESSGHGADAAHGVFQLRQALRQLASPLQRARKLQLIMSGTQGNGVAVVQLMGSVMGAHVSHLTIAMVRCKIAGA